MYCDRNFKTKKELKKAVSDYVAFKTNPDLYRLNYGLLTLNPSKPFVAPREVTVYQPGPFGGNVPANGKVYLEGPHYPEPHRWYATAILENGIVVKVS